MKAQWLQEQEMQKEIARRMLAVETQICQEQGMHIKLAPDVVAIFH